jgi:glycosyltransferase involved in cell wall biosynthesis
MKIGIEIQRLFRKKKYGIETSSLSLIKKIQEIEKSIEFVVFAKDNLDRNCFSASPNFKIEKVAGKLFADFEHIFLPIAAKREKIDLLHCTGNTTPYFSPVPIIQTLHDVIFMDPIPRKDSLYQQVGNLYRRKLVPVTARRSSAIITVSNYEKERIVSRLGIDEQKISVIYNGIDNTRFHLHRDPLNADRIRTEYNLPDDFILFLGNTAGRKNSLGAIEAYLLYLSRASNPLPLVTPGLSQHFIIQTLKKLNAPYDPGKFITPGYIKDEDLPYLYAMSKLFLFPSLSEGFGMPIVEAMACGTPVITSNISCMPEIAGNAALLVDPLNASAIADGLLKMQNNDAYRLQKINDGLINASRFSWNRTAENVLAVYEKVLQPSQQIKALSPYKKFVKRALEPSLYLFNKPKDITGGR